MFSSGHLISQFDHFPAPDTATEQALVPGQLRGEAAAPNVQTLEVSEGAFTS